MSLAGPVPVNRSAMLALIWSATYRWTSIELAAFSLGGSSTSRVVPGRALTSAHPGSCPVRARLSSRRTASWHALAEIWGAVDKHHAHAAMQAFGPYGRSCHLAASPRARLTSRNPPCEKKGHTQGPGTPPTRRDSRATRHAPTLDSMASRSDKLSIKITKDAG